MIQKILVAVVTVALVLGPGAASYAQEVPAVIQEILAQQGMGPDAARLMQKIQNREPIDPAEFNLNGVNVQEILSVITAETGMPIRVQENAQGQYIVDLPTTNPNAFPTPSSNFSYESAPSGPASGEVVVNSQGTSKILDLLDLKNMDVLDVLKLISQKSGLNIIATQNVKGRVTVYLKNVGVEEALAIIVEAYGWAFERDGEILKVMTAQEFESKHGSKFGQETETRIVKLKHVKAADVLNVLNQVKSESGKVITDDKSGVVIMKDSVAKLEEMDRIIARLDVPIETEVFELSYATAEELSPKIQESLTADVGHVKFDARSNTVMVSDTAAKLEKIRKLIQAFDRKDREVLIEAKILQITLTDEHKLGVDWEAIVSDFHNLDLVSDFDVLQSTDKRGTLSIGTLSQDNYTAVVEALDTIGVTDILSSPRITTVNNKEAKILVGSTEPYVTTTTTTPSSGPTTTAESVNFIEVGVKLYVTPTIHKDDFITMKIKPEVSAVTSNLTTSNNNTIPIVETSEAETTVLVKDGVTIVIGGLIKEETIKTTRQIPLLGKIPGIGAAFRNVNDQVSKTEIVIFLTPRIISGDIDEMESADAFSSL